MQSRKPNTFHLICDEPWFSFIRAGIKPVEGRKNSPKYQKIKVGDFIEFTNGKEKFLTLVTEIRSYATLEDYLNDVTISKALPNVSSMEEAINIYHQWSTPEEIQQHGFLGIFVYRNNLKNREFGKEGPQNFYSERATIAERQGASENENYEGNLTMPKTDFPSCFGISLI